MHPGNKSTIARASKLEGTLVMLCAEELSKQQACSPLVHERAPNISRHRCQPSPGKCISPNFRVWRFIFRTVCHGDNYFNFMPMANQHVYFHHNVLHSKGHCLYISTTAIMSVSLILNKFWRTTIWGYTISFVVFVSTRIPRHFS